MIAFWNHFPVCNTSYSLPNLVSSSSTYRGEGRVCFNPSGWEDWKVIWRKLYVVKDMKYWTIYFHVVVGGVYNLFLEMIYIVGESV